jgi:hypothetical protein
MKRTLSGAAHGKGAVYAWEGNKDIGKDFEAGLSNLKTVAES